MRVLHICYFGVKENLVQTQVLPYLEKLATHGHQMSILTFEPDFYLNWNQAAIDQFRVQLAARGINWIPTAYHKRPAIPATLYDVCRAIILIWRMSRRSKIDLLHARSHIPMLIGLIARKFTGAALLFDIRGLMADEYADAGIWRSSSITYRVIKYLERMGIGMSDHLVVLTKRLKEHLVEQGQSTPDRISVIPCCIDMRRFTDYDDTKKIRLPFQVIYAGSVTGLYLLEEMGRLFLAISRLVPEATLKILTSVSPSETALVLGKLGIDTSRFDIQSVTPDQVPQLLRAATVGISFRKPTFSQIAASPTKIPEYLIAGLPVVSSVGIGDTDKILCSENVGILVDQLNDFGYDDAAQRLLTLLKDPHLQLRCQTVARRYFDLDDVGERLYANAYQKIEGIIGLK